MRICVLTTSFPRSEQDDAGIFVKHLVLAYSKLGHKTLVIVPKDQNETETEDLGSLQIKRYKYGVFTKGRLAFGAGIMPNLRNRPTLIFQAPALLLLQAASAISQSKNFDIIHANWILSGFAAFLVNIITKKPYILTLRGEDMKLLRKKNLLPILSLVLKRAKKIISVNQSFKDEIIKSYKLDANKIMNIQNGVNIPDISPTEIENFAKKENLNFKFLLFVGRIIPLKKVEVLFEIISKLPEFKLVICGRIDDQVYYQNLQKTALALKVEDRIIFKGQVAPAEVSKYLKLAKFYVSASEFEGRPNSILESFAAKTPVIASNIPAHAEIIKNLETGILFDPNNIAELIKQFQSLQSSDLEKFTKNAFAIVAEQSWENCAQRYLAEMG